MREKAMIAPSAGGVRVGDIFVHIVRQDDSRGRVLSTA
jgi:hypothetical protein